MSLKILFVDELRGFYKSKVMIALWIGLPLFTIFIHTLQSNIGGGDPTAFSATFFVGLLATSLCGTLASVSLATSIVNERINKVYDLFLIRPVKRSDILIAKFLAIYLCIVMALILSLILGIIIDTTSKDLPIDIILDALKETIAFSLAGMAIACCVGILFGLISKSVMVAAILAIYIGNQISSIIYLPILLIEDFDPILFSVLIGLGGTLLLMVLNIRIFNNKQL